MVQFNGSGCAGTGAVSIAYLLDGQVCMHASADANPSMHIQGLSRGGDLHVSGQLHIVGAEVALADLQQACTAILPCHLQKFVHGFKAHFVQNARASKRPAHMWQPG